MYKCKYCDKEFKSLGGCKGHEYAVHENKHTNIIICKFCKKEFKEQGHYKHEVNCPENPDSKAYQKYKNKQPKNGSQEGNCQYCKKYCRNQNSLKNHERLCKKNPQHKLSPFIAYNEKLKTGEVTHWAKGQTAESNVSIAQSRDKGKITKQAKDYSGWHHTEETKKRIGKASAINLREGYASGRLKSPKGVGRGKYSYFIYNDNMYLLRSTWEFIFALYLATKQVQFNVEAIRVPAVSDNPYSHTFISDFSVGNTVIEIKGVASEKDYYIKESFEAAGYDFVELFEKDILNIKNELISCGFNIDTIIKQIVDGHKVKEYFIYRFE